MPRKKSVPIEDQELSEQANGVPAPDEASVEGSAVPPPEENSDGAATESGDLMPEGDPFDMSSGEYPSEEAPLVEGSAGDFPEAESSPFPQEGEGPTDGQPADGASSESDDAEYEALLQEWSETVHADGSTADGNEEPLVLDPPPEAGQTSEPVSMEAEDVTGSAGNPSSGRSNARSRRSGAAVSSRPSATDPRRERVLTIDAREEIQTAEDQEAVIWHEIQNAHWTRRILTGKLDKIISLTLSQYRIQEVVRR